jgi:hypothetical protein
VEVWAGTLAGVDINIYTTQHRRLRVWDLATQRVASCCYVQCPIMGVQHPQASYLSPEWEVSVMPLHVDWHLASWIFCMDFLGKT